jgi:hypothetical protein
LGAILIEDIFEEYGKRMKIPAMMEREARKVNSIKL